MRPGLVEGEAKIHRGLTWFEDWSSRVQVARLYEVLAVSVATNASFNSQDVASHRIRTVSSSCRGPDVIAAASAVQIRHLDIASDDSEEDKTLLQHHTNTVVSVPVVRSVVVAVRTTNVVRFVVPGAAPQNAERPRATDPSPSAQTHGGVIAEPALCSDRFTNASLSESTNPRIFKLARRAAPVAEIANRRNRIRVTEDQRPERQRLQRPNRRGRTRKKTKHYSNTTRIPISVPR